MVFGGSRAGRYRRKVATPSSPEHVGAPLIFAEAQFQGRPTFYTRWLASIFLDLSETILVYKFPQLTREEIRAVLHLPVTDVKKTRSYQDAFVKGREEGREETRRELILSQLARRCGVLTPWNVAVSADTDRSLRMFLASPGGDRKGDLSRFIEEPVQSHILELTAEQAKAANARLSEAELTSMLDEAL
jgi:hypothetical protein